MLSSKTYPKMAMAKSRAKKSKGFGPFPSEKNNILGCHLDF
jgi:hypothetical protein